jgi:hypothetical protein
MWASVDPPCKNLSNEGHDRENAVASAILQIKCLAFEKHMQRIKSRLANKLLVDYMHRILYAPVPYTKLPMTVAAPGFEFPS